MRTPPDAMPPVPPAESEGPRPDRPADSEDREGPEDREGRERPREPADPGGAADARRPGRSGRPGASDVDADETVSAIHWAEALGRDEGMASVNWLAADVDPARPTAEALLTDPEVALDALLAAKSAYKTLRVVGETASERRLGARWYAVAIAAAIVHHGSRISSQSDAALDRAFASLVDDETMPPPVRELVVRALFRLRSGTLLDREPRDDAGGRRGDP